MPFRDMYIEGKNVTRIVKALSNDVRIKILDLLDDQELNIQALADELELGKTTILTHLNILEEAGFITTRYVPGSVGNQKLCRKEYDRLIFNFSPNRIAENDEGYFEYSIPVGNYFDFEVYPPCGIASKDNVIKKWDVPSVLYDIERLKADIVWASYGFLMYKLPLAIPFPTQQIKKIKILFEVSAQGGITTHKALNLPEYLNKSDLTDGISDITFWLNDVEIGTLTFREYRRGGGGKFTPTWWKGSNFGELVQIQIDSDGVSLDGNCQTELSLKDFLLSDHINLKLGNKRDAKNISGFNLYGQNFGNYHNDIVLRIYN